VNAGRDSGRPIAADEFAAAMAALGPFERSPRLAVAVSGGADSMALLLLAREWAAARDGQVTALTVDHGLRPEAAAEAEQVGRWAAALGIAHRILSWTGPKPTGDVQAAARAARYRVLEERCADTGTFHLLLAHHREDQAETFLLRLARGSGLDGLAAMSPVVERPHCRLLRPLLAMPRDGLRATLAARNQQWLDDPSNENAKFARARLRQSEAVLAREGLSAARLAATARRLARTRQALERSVAQLLARVATPDPAGFIRLDPAKLGEAPEELGLRALAALLMAVSGGDYPPRLERLERLYRELRTRPGRGRTLVGCRIVPHRGAVLICREIDAMAPPVAARPGASVAWDGRFRLSVPNDAPEGLILGALGTIRVNEPARRLPAAARAGIGALLDENGVVAAPALGYRRDDRAGLRVAREAMLLRSTRPATSAGVKVV
jgi:tRNA(Ile)-lysidine synthase